MIALSKLPESLAQYGLEHFDELFALHPSKRGRIFAYGYDMDVSRWHASYLQTPDRRQWSEEEQQTTNYMFSDTSYDLIKNELPQPFQSFHQYIGEEYNQVTINWFQDGKDYIPNHKDCTIGLDRSVPIKVISLGAERLLSVKLGVKRERIKLTHGTIVDMDPEIQHGIPKIIDQQCGRRISISFRKYTSLSTGQTDEK